MTPRRLCWLALLALCSTAAADKRIREPVQPRLQETPSYHVLLLADAAIRDYQFTRSLFVRMCERNQVGLNLCLPGRPRVGVAMDIPPEHLLDEFPGEMKPFDRTKPGTRAPENLAAHDLIIAFDADWSKIDARSLRRLRQWVEQGGGLVFIAGEVNTPALARAAGKERDRLRPLLDLLPVLLAEPDGLAPTDAPRRLRFAPAARDLAFLRLDDNDKPLSGWNSFFAGKKDDGDETKMENGFFSAAPVAGVKRAATVLARVDPKPGVPYLVSMPVGRGRVLYVGSAESWRLRRYHEDYHERFWRGLAEYMTTPPAPGPKNEKKGGTPESALPLDWLRQRTDEARVQLALHKVLWYGNRILAGRDPGRAGRPPVGPVRALQGPRVRGSQPAAGRQTLTSGACLVCSGSRQTSGFGAVGSLATS